MARFENDKKEIKSINSEKINNRDKKTRDLKLKEARRSKETKKFC